MTEKSSTKRNLSNKENGSKFEKKKESNKKKRRVRIEPDGLDMGFLIAQSKKVNKYIIENVYKQGA